MPKAKRKSIKWYEGQINQNQGEMEDIKDLMSQLLENRVAFKVQKTQKEQLTAKMEDLNLSNEKHISDLKNMDIEKVANKSLYYETLADAYYLASEIAYEKCKLSTTPYIDSYEISLKAAVKNYTLAFKENQLNKNTNKMSELLKSLANSYFWLVECYSDRTPEKRLYSAAVIGIYNRYFSELQCDIHSLPKHDQETYSRALEYVTAKINFHNFTATINQVTEKFELEQPPKLSQGLYSTLKEYQKTKTKSKGKKINILELLKNELASTKKTSEDNSKNTVEEKTGNTQIELCNKLSTTTLDVSSTEAEGSDKENKGNTNNTTLNVTSTHNHKRKRVQSGNDILRTKKARTQNSAACIANNESIADSTDFSTDESSMEYTSIQLDKIYGDFPSAFFYYRKQDDELHEEISQSLRKQYGF